MNDYYTRTPNEFFDSILREIDSLPEIKVTLAIIRLTRGYGKREDEVSYKQLESATGMTNKSVYRGVTAALKRGYVKREPRGKTYVYSISDTGEVTVYATGEVTVPENTDYRRGAGEITGEVTVYATGEVTATKERERKTTTYPPVIENRSKGELAPWQEACGVLGRYKESWWPLSKAKTIDKIRGLKQQHPETDPLRACTNLVHREADVEREPVHNPVGMLEFYFANPHVVEPEPPPSYFESLPIVEEEPWMDEDREFFRELSRSLARPREASECEA